MCHFYTNVISLGDASVIARSPKEEVYAQIITDLKAAEVGLPPSTLLMKKAVQQVVLQKPYWQMCIYDRR